VGRKNLKIGDLTQFKIYFHQIKLKNGNELFNHSTVQLSKNQPSPATVIRYAHTFATSPEGDGKGVFKHDKARFLSS
jgi:hypothetical protein